MPSSKLAAAVQSIDWNANVAQFVGETVKVEAIASAHYRLAVWAKQIEDAEGENPAICFVREMQVAAQNSAAALAVALYKPAASSMRAMLETALYYTYFRVHPAELVTLVRDSKYYVDKQELLDYHKQHTPRFTERQGKVDLVGRLNTWYSSASAVIHGQLPGTWVTHTALKDLKFHTQTLEAAVDMLRTGEELVHHLFLITLADALWDKFAAPAKKVLIKGLAGEFKSLLGLDAA